jgi:phenylpropionate dioxygenase-like ring-hydroxylating dioxygenase large terminal subunit
MKPTLLHLFLTGCFCLLLSATQASAQPSHSRAKLSSGTKKYLKQLAQHNKTCPYHDAEGNRRYVPTTIRVRGGLDTTQFERLGVRTGTRAGYIWTVQVPADEMPSFIHLEGIDYIQVDDLPPAPHPAE